MPSAATNTEWDHQYDTIRRDGLFRNPPSDHTAYPALQAAVDPHIESFNAIFGDGTSPSLLDHALADIGTKTYLDGDDRTDPALRNRLAVRVTKVALARPQLPPTNKTATRREVFPAECRERHTTYRGRLTAKLEYQINDGEPIEFERDFGLVPIMLKSNRCHLEGNSPKLLVRRKEESEELGGYFVVNGIEKIIRMLQVNKRNFPMAIIRPSFTSRGPDYTPYGIIMRSVRPDETPQTNVLHYLSDGNVTFRFSWRKNEYLVPVMMILKALIATNDRDIFESVVGPAGTRSSQDTFLTERLEMLMRSYKVYGLYSREETRAYLGSKFRVVLGVPETMSDYDVGTEFLRRIVLVHLGNVDVTEEQDADKFRILIFMIRKLYVLFAGDCAADNPDAVQNQEVLLGGFLYGQLLKERLDEFLSTNLRGAIREHFRRSRTVASFTSEAFASDFPNTIFRKASENLGNALEYFLSTGNLQSPSGLDLQQTAGFTVVAEKLNFLRFISHFRMIHRGAFFAQLKTTAVRKLLPESWGFLCPVHTPDGSPCGLLNHLAHKCKIVTQPLDVSSLPRLAGELGALPKTAPVDDGNVVVMLDGRIIGWCTPEQAEKMAACLRYWKVEGSHDVPLHLEIGYVPQSSGGSFPGLYLASTAARLVRPVRFVPLGGREDFVGPYEQPFMSIAVVPEEIVEGRSTHVEVHPTHMLSIVANMTPFSDFNQSPRNMYQCQMGKQTMGTPGTALRYRTDNKAYRLQTGQTPVVRAPLHNTYGFDNFPNGTNAVVAVISYTGYDMDDAMVINKSSHERGFGHGTIYKTKVVSLRETSTKRGAAAASVTKAFGFAPFGRADPLYREGLDDDGLPHVGRLVREGDVLYAWHKVTMDYHGKLINTDGETRYERYREAEAGFVEEVRLIGAETGREPLQTISIKLRVPRGPVIGDKFSSRHGQKGVLSQRWAAEDLPFTEGGMQPDVIINPHAFPSRMTIGMFVESLAGKSGALHGLAQDSTPFQFNEGSTAADHFGAQLAAAGFNYHGNEPMYSGTTGEELGADIYIGVVYYQRLRHMVNDKFQVRTTGPVVPTTGQPIKGRRRGGGIRVGEMERDALLAHGTAFLLQDRLLNCSDYARAWVCRRCGSFLSTQPAVSHYVKRSRRRLPSAIRCRRCSVRVAGPGSGEAEPEPEDGNTAVAARTGKKNKKNGAAAAAAAAAANSVTDPDLAGLQGEMWTDGHGVQWIGGDQTTCVVVPGALRYLDVELAAMGIKLRYRVSRRDEPRKGPMRPMLPPGEEEDEDEDEDEDEEFGDE